MQTLLDRQMNAAILFIIGIPLIEIYLMIKIGGVIGAFNTIFLILFTAVTGVYFAKLAGISTIRSGIGQLVRNELNVSKDEILSVLDQFVRDENLVVVESPLDKK